MASTADIQVSANRGRTTQELHRDALSEKEEKKKHTPVEGVAEGRQEGREQTRQRGKVAQLHKHTQTAIITTVAIDLTLIHTAAWIRKNVWTDKWKMTCNHVDSFDSDNC